MEKHDDKFRTSDITLASFLFMRDVPWTPWAGVELMEQGTRRCNFVFNVSPNDPGLAHLIGAWSNSDQQVKELQHILYAHKTLKKSVSEFLTKQNEQDDQQYEPDFLGL